MKTIKIYFFSLILIISNLSFADVKNGRRSEIPNSEVGFSKYMKGTISAKVYADQLFIRMSPERFNLVIEDLREKFERAEMTKSVLYKRTDLEQALTEQAIKYNSKVSEYNKSLYKGGFVVGAIVGLIGGRILTGGIKTHPPGAKLTTYTPVYPNDIQVSPQVYQRYAANPSLYTDDTNAINLVLISGISLTSGAIGSIAFYIASKTETGLNLLGRTKIDIDQVNTIHLVE